MTHILRERTLYKLYIQTGVGSCVNYSKNQSPSDLTCANPDPLGCDLYLLVTAGSAAFNKAGVLGVDVAFGDVPLIIARVLIMDQNTFDPLVVPDHLIATF